MRSLREMEDWVSSLITEIDDASKLAPFIEDLGIECLIYGTECADYAISKGHTFDTVTDSMEYIIGYGHTRWNQIVEYCDSKYNIELLPYGFLYLCSSTNTDSEEYNDIMKESTMHYINKISDEDDNKYKKYKSLSVTETNNLISEYFTLINKLGTFYKDKTKYKTEEEVKMHERIMEIYNTVFHR